MRFRYALKKMDIIDAPTVAEANEAIKRIANEYSADIALPATPYTPASDIKAFGLSGTIKKLIEHRVATGEADADEIEVLAKFNTLGHF